MGGGVERRRTGPYIMYVYRYYIYIYYIIYYIYIYVNPVYIYIDKSLWKWIYDDLWPSPIWLNSIQLDHGTYAVRRALSEYVDCRICWIPAGWTWAMAMQGVLLWREETLHHLGWSKPYKSAHTALAVKACLLGGNSNTKCSMTFVNIAVAIAALAGGGPKTVSHRDQNTVVFSTFFEDFWVSERKRVLKWNFGSFW